MADKKCFIIMPVTTPSELVERYSGDEEHFKHVLEHLFIPAIEKLDLEPIPPIVRGAEVIHAEIIKNLEISDCVLCDMSILNPNVFFELGIRTAINKPVALVKDDGTPKVPFDTNIINNLTYSHTLAPWSLEKEIEALSDHLKHCFEGEQTENSLWKYFSLSAKVEPLGKPTTKDEKIDFLSMQVAAIRKELEKNKYEITKTERYDADLNCRMLDKEVSKLVESEGVRILSSGWGKGGGYMVIRLSAPISQSLIDELKHSAATRKISLDIEVEK